MMIVSKEIEWVMGHALSAPYVGPCNRLHGHNWKVKFDYQGEMNDSGMVIDFAEFRKMKKWIDEFLDHRFYIKEGHLVLEPYDEGGGEYSPEVEILGLVPVSFNPTSENMAQMLHEVACGEMKLEPSNLRVTVWETCTSSATYEGLR